MKLIVYDVEVFRFDWIVVFKDVETGIHTVVHNDSEALRECLYDDGIFLSTSSFFSFFTFPVFDTTISSCGFLNLTFSNLLILS